MKKFLCMMFGYMVLFLVIKDRAYLNLILLPIVILLLYICKSSFCIWISLKWKLFKEIRNRRYFFITEKGQKTDLKKRREIGEAIYYITNGIFLLIFLFLIITTSYSINVERASNVLLEWGLWIAILGVILASKNYIAGFYYYAIPWLALFSKLSDIDFDDSINFIILFLCIVVILYFILTLLLPLYSLRKITNTTWIFGVLTTLLIQIFVEYMLNICNDGLQNLYDIETITLEELKQVNLSDNWLTIFEREPVLIDILNKFIEICINDQISSIRAQVSLIGFLLLISYSIGSILINLKIKLGESKAKDIYVRIKEAKDVRYVDLRDCIFYGGDKYEDKIMEQEEYEKIIVDEEKKYNRYEETCGLIIFFDKTIQYCMKILKKMI